MGRNPNRVGPEYFTTTSFEVADGGRGRNGGGRRTPRLWTRASAEFQSAWRSRTDVSTRCVQRVAYTYTSYAHTQPRARPFAALAPHIRRRTTPPRPFTAAIHRSLTFALLRAHTNARTCINILCMYINIHARIRCGARERCNGWWRRPMENLVASSSKNERPNDVYLYTYEIY